MENEKRMLSGTSSEQKLTYFEIQSWWGATKHMGGLSATKELVELCQIKEGKYILDVGCGVGATSCYIAKMHNCKVVGIDITRKMLDWAKGKAKEKVVKGRVEFVVADVQNLPFKDNTFDVVIGESVITFVKDKQRAVRECVRVTKSGGFTGLNEETWVKPPPQNFVEYASKMWDIETEILNQDRWEKMLKESRLKDLRIKIRAFSASWNEYISELSRYGIIEVLGMMYRAIILYLKNPAFRKYTKGRFTSLPNRFFDYLGYGIYVGMK